MKKHYSLAYSIFGLIAFAVLGVTSSLYLISINSLRHSIADAEENGVENVYAVIRTAVDEYLRLLSSAAVCLGDHRLLGDAIENDTDEAGRERLHRIAEEIHGKLKTPVFRVSDTAERILFSTDIADAASAVRPLWGVAEALSGRDVTTVVNDLGVWEIRAVAPVRKNGRVIGTVTVGDRINNAFIRNLRLDMDNISVAIATPDGIIARTYQPDIPVMAESAFSACHISDSIKKDQVFHEKHPEMRRNCYYRRLSVGDSLFGLIVEFDTSESEQRFLHANIKIAGISGAIFLSATMLGVGFTRKLLRPLRYLERQSDETVRSLTGRSGPRLPGNEIDSLVASFELMRHMLITRIARIEQAEEELQFHKRRLEQLVTQLQQKNTALKTEIAERERAERELEKLHRELIEASRRAGMAQVATDVLHNVGNVLNSINVSAAFVSDKLSASKLARLRQTIGMIRENINNIGTFFTDDPRGRHIPVYLEEVAALMADEEKIIAGRLETMMRNIDHIKEIVKTQQSYARMAGVRSTVAIREVIGDAIQINRASLDHHQISVDYCPDEDALPVEIDRQRTLQILVNLVDNAKDSLVEARLNDRLISISFEQSAELVRICVGDNGGGIAPENISRIFEHGFTTREAGHGFGLHSSVLAANEMGGKLSAFSNGIGHGAVFTLELPLTQSQYNKGGVS